MNSTTILKPEKMFLMFNHSLSREQETDARNVWGEQLRFVGLPPELRALWAQIPADEPRLFDLLAPFRQWLENEAATHDIVLVQGDFGATWLMVNHALNRNLIPVYSVTARRASEEIQQDLTVKAIHIFKHRMFRLYGA